MIGKQLKRIFVVFACLLIMVTSAGCFQENPNLSIENRDNLGRQITFAETTYDGIRSAFEGNSANSQRLQNANFSDLLFAETENAIILKALEIADKLNESG